MKLTPWHHLQHKLKSEEPFDDPTSRILRSCLAYVETLLTDGESITRMMNVPAASGYYNWMQLLEVSRDGLFLEETLSGPKRILTRQHGQLRQLLAQYIATRR